MNFHSIVNFEKMAECCCTYDCRRLEVLNLNENSQEGRFLLGVISVD